MSELNESGLKSLETRLGYTFKRRELLVLSLTHPSWEQEDESARETNQRLEFLGDSVLGLIVADKLYATYPKHPEGFLTRNRSALVKGKVLVSIATEIGLESHLRLGRAEQNAGNRGRHSRLEDALEALVGAVYLDGGLKAARRVVLHLYGDLGERLSQGLSDHNAKGQLQEFVQSKGGSTSDIDYVLSDTTGPDHQRRFTVQLEVNGIRIGSGEAASRKAAESIAARNGLSALMQRAAETGGAS